jgi:hypothetical protein
MMNLKEVFWKTSQYNGIATLKGHTNWTFPLAILNNTNIVSGSKDKSIII